MITDIRDTWLVDSSASKHMKGYQDSLKDVAEKELALQVEFGDNAKFAVKGDGSVVV